MIDKEKGGKTGMGMGGREEKRENGRRWETERTRLLN